MLGLYRCTWLPLVAVSGSYSLTAVCELLIVVASLVEYGLQSFRSWSSQALERRLSSCGAQT